jgi:hypothetical protein
MESGKILTVLVIATLLAVIGARVIAYRYRASMQRLMKIPLNSGSTAGSGCFCGPGASPCFHGRNCQQRA